MGKKASQETHCVSFQFANKISHVIKKRETYLHEHHRDNQELSKKLSNKALLWRNHPSIKRNPIFLEVTASQLFDLEVE